MPSHQELVIADHRADRVYSLRDGVVSSLGTGVAAEHAGLLSFTDGAFAFADDKGGALVSCTAEEGQRIPIAIPAEHIAADISGRHVVITTGLGVETEPWSDVVTLADRQTGDSVRFRTRIGEPGALIAPDQSDGSLHVVLRHREPGAIEALPLSACLDAGPHCRRLGGQVTDALADDGHGDVVDPVSGIIATATSRGLERFVIDSGRPRAIGIVPWPVPGRAFYLRLGAGTGTALGIVRGGPTAPDRWTEWTNTLVEINLATGEAAGRGLPAGLAFRFGLGGHRIAVAAIHPGGDTLTLVDRSAGDLRTVRTIALPAMSRPPCPGRMPWDAVAGMPAQRRSVAVDPAGSTIAVTRGGDGEVHLFGEGAAATHTVPTPLDEGGQLLFAGSAPDPVGR